MKYTPLLNFFFMFEENRYLQILCREHGAMETIKQNLCYFQVCYCNFLGPKNPFNSQQNDICGVF